MVDYSRYGSMIAAAKFSIPDSPLRSRDSNDVAQTTRSNPVQDSVELTRNYPELLMPQTYAPETAQKVLALKDESTEASGFEKQNADETDDSAAVAGEAEADGEEAAEANGETDASGQALDEGEQKQLQELKARDQEVRTHEQAHMAAGGQYAGGVSYEYQQGPDGRRYAVGGEVSIDTSAEKDPEATIAKMRQVRSAALAPAEPSPQDRSVAAAAAQAEGEARQELREEQQASAAEGANGGQSGQGGEGESDSAAATAAAESDSTSAGKGASVGRLSSNRYINAYVNNGVDSSPYRQSISSASVGRTPLDVVA